MIAPKEPRSGKERRRLLKATTHRLARLIGKPCAVLAKSEADDLFMLIRSRLGGGIGSGAGEAGRLARKLIRLR